MPAATRRLHRAISVPAVGIIAGSLLVACGGGPSRETKDYCPALAAQQSLLVLPISTVDDVTTMVDRYLAMARRAPLAVQDSWQRLARLMQAAATIDISDPAARLEVIQQAYETKRDADVIVAHAQATCNVTIDVSGTTTTTTVVVTTTTSTAATSTAATPTAATTATTGAPAPTTIGAASDPATTTATPPAETPPVSDTLAPETTPAP